MHIRKGINLQIWCLNVCVCICVSSLVSPYSYWRCHSVCVASGCHFRRAWVYSMFCVISAMPYPNIWSILEHLQWHKTSACGNLNQSPSHSSQKSSTKRLGRHIVRRQVQAKGCISFPFNWLHFFCFFFLMAEHLFHIVLL